MKERKEQIQVEIVGNWSKINSVMESVLGNRQWHYEIHDKHIVKDNFAIRVNRSVEDILDLYGMNIEEYVSSSKPENIENCQVVIYIDPTPDDRKFIEFLTFKNNPIFIEYNNTTVTPIECLRHIEFLINQRLEKSLLVYQGYMDNKSPFSYLPRELDDYISNLHYQVSSNHSAQSFFKPVAVLPQTAEEQKQEILFSQCTIQQ